MNINVCILDGQSSLGNTLLSSQRPFEHCSIVLMLLALVFSLQFWLMNVPAMTIPSFELQIVLDPLIIFPDDDEQASIVILVVLLLTFLISQSL
jgi:hypothetical protein